MVKVLDVERESHHLLDYNGDLGSILKALAELSLFQRQSKLIGSINCKP